MNVLDWSIPYMRHFEEMSRIPHGTFHEKIYSDYLVDWAKAHKMAYVQDEMNNVIIYKAGSRGYEDHPPVILQAHMDMVCAKLPESKHDFLKDSLELYVEDGFLKAKGTTLGGDDGVGVAYMLAILESEEMNHPPLECVFTVQEEAGCNGAAFLKKEYFQARRMIGLDDVGGGTSYVSTAGGRLLKFSREADWVENHLSAYELNVDGLLSGHSGADIDKERGNAIKLAGRILYELQKQGTVALGEFAFGVAQNVIPANGCVKFATDIKEEKLKAVVDKYTKIFKKELEFSDAGLEMELKNCRLNKVMSVKDSREIISFFRFIPYGMFHHSMRFENLPVASSNVGTLLIEDGKMVSEGCHRGALDSYIDELDDLIDMLCDTYHIEKEVTAIVPTFEYVENSPLRNILWNAFLNETGRELKLECIHGGIEAGYFKQLYPEMDIVTIGPLVLDEHMVTERLDLKSFHEIWKVLVNVLERL